MINVGLVGLGFIGKAHFQAYQSMGNVTLKTICTRNPVEDETIIAKFNGKFVNDFNELLRDDEIDIIDICLPTYLHEEHIIQAAQAGKHIICEKPLTLNEQSFNRIIEAVDRHDVRLFVGHVLRFWPEYELIKQYSETEKLNGIEIVHATRLSQAPAWSDWFKDPEKSGGALYDLHIHDIDFLYSVLGDIDQVFATGTKNDQGAWDHIMTTLIFKNGTKAFVEASHKMPEHYPFTMTLRLQAKNNHLDFAIKAGENIDGLEEGSQQFIYYSKDEPETVVVEDADPFKKELAYFCECVLNNTENKKIPLEDVRYVLRLMHAIETSLEKEKIVTV